MNRHPRVRDYLRALTLGSALLAPASHAAASPAPIPHGALELIPENQWITAGHEFDIGLHFQLEKGWHIYWVNPGDSGEPPRVTWHLPEGLTAGAIEWPTPVRLAHSSVVDFGYEDSVTLIVPIHAAASVAAHRPAQLAADVKVLVCREVCIPGKAQLALTLPVKSADASDPPANSSLAAARKSLPQPAPANWRFTARDAKESVVLIASVGRQVTQATFFPLVDPQIENAAPQTLVSTPRGFRLTLRKSSRLVEPIDRLKGVLALSPGSAYVVDVPLIAARASTKPTRSGQESNNKIQFARASAGGLTK